jgi:phosphoribosylformylglycinamidine synthase I
MTKKVKALIITGFGLNCEKETAKAFELAGAKADQVHLNDLFDNKESLQDYHILAFIGGFSFGDHLGAGTIFANRIKSQMSAELEKFVDSGKLIIGICNGFQTITRLGLVPATKDLFEQEVALAFNKQEVFRNSWCTLVANPESPSIFTKDIDVIPLPYRHGEGRFCVKDEAILQELEAQNLVCLRYADPETDLPTDEFPHNPNGSVNSIAGLCDKTGRIFGLMPHPEAYLSPFNHPHWGRQKINHCLPEEGLGLKIFRNAVNYANENLV